MKFLKNIFAFLIPLCAMLLTFTLYLLIDNVVENYKKKISRDYSIVIVTNTPLIKENIDELAGIKVERIQTLPKEKRLKAIYENIYLSRIIKGDYKFAYLLLSITFIYRTTQNSLFFIIKAFLNTSTNKFLK
mgnify:CR=1 FL=1